jgi:hypothetical protein
MSFDKELIEAAINLGYEETKKQLLENICKVCEDKQIVI